MDVEATGGVGGVMGAVRGVAEDGKGGDKGVTKGQAVRPPRVTIRLPASVLLVV
jgi:hypothetical protein